METGAKMPSSLAKICVGSIVQNIGSYRIALKRKLAPPAREMVLHELKTNDKCINGRYDGFAFAMAWADLPFLLNSRTRKFTSRWLANMLQNSVLPRPIQPILQQLLVYLSEQAPNLEYLELFFSREDAPLHIGNREMFAIGRMEKLTKIAFSGIAMKLEDIRSLTIKCKNLQEISADAVEIEEKPTFSFDKFPFQTIRAFGSEKNRIRIELKNALSEGEYPTAGYRFLHLVPQDISQLSFMEKLTNLTRFEFDCGELEDEDMMEEFPYSLPSLDFAEINHSSGNVLRKFLEKHGEKLDRLRIGEAELAEDMSYAQLFNWCPKLKHLHLYDWYLSGNEIQINCFEHLQNIDIDDHYEYGFDRPALQLSCILSAPNLIGVYISAAKFELGDYQSLIARITKREIFKNLKFLYLSDKDCGAYYRKSKKYTYKPFFGRRERLVELEDAIKLSR